MVLQNRDLIDKYGFLQKIVKIDTEKENANTVAKRELNENAKVNETFSFEIVEKYDSYTRAGEVISVDGVKYAIESTSHSYKDGWHFDKLELSKLEWTVDLKWILWYSNYSFLLIESSFFIIKEL